MKLISKILVAITILLSLTACQAQINNSKTDNIKVYGNCKMCKKTIEKAGSINKIAKVDWNVQTKMATITYDSKQTNIDEILQRIALSGYDADKFFTTSAAYLNLPECCQYDRSPKAAKK